MLLQNLKRSERLSTGNGENGSWNLVLCGDALGNLSAKSCALAEECATFRKHRKIMENFAAIFDHQVTRLEDSSVAD